MNNKKDYSNKISRSLPLSFCFISKIPLFELYEKLLIELYDSYMSKSNFTMEFYLSLIFHYFTYNVTLLNEIAISHNGKLIRYRNYSEIGITIPNFTFKVLLKHIDPEYIIILIQLILLERRIIFVKKDCSINAIIIESLFQLICPL